MLKRKSKGSPPQVRGKPTARSEQSPHIRITPAGAGKTLFTAFEFGQVPGSPPQVRGKQGFGTDYALGDRITPAGAGKTLTTSRSYLTL